jgi:tripartite ATP-independent transporter DctM subunit
MSPEVASMVMLGFVVAGIILGIPVAYVLCGLPLIFGFIFFGDKIFPMYVSMSYSMLRTYSLVTVPLFIFMGTILERSGIAENLYRTLFYVLGGVRGGLAIITIIVGTIFGACTGSVGASIVCIGLLALPSMLKYGYHKELAAGPVLCAGGLGLLIPPSLVMILYGSTAGLNIATLFIGGVGPGVLLAALFVTYILIRVRLKPSMAPIISPEERAGVTGRELARMALTSVVPPIFLIFAVMGTLFMGVAGPSEAGAMGAIGGLIVVAAGRRLNWAVLKDSLMSALRITSFVLFIVLGGKLFQGVFMRLGGGGVITDALLGVPGGTFGIMVGCLVIVWIAGCFMDYLALIYILAPILHPLMVSVGVDPIYFGCMFATALQIGNMTPPFAYSVFYLKGIAPPGVTIGDLYRAAVPFVLMQTVGVVILLFVPQIVTWLPSLMKAGAAA